MFKEEREELKFCWDDLGDIQQGRPNLGDTTTVTAYRLMQYTLRDVLIRRLGPEAAGAIFYEAGKKAGHEFCRNILDRSQDFNRFFSQVQQKLKEHKMGVFRVEDSDPDHMKLTITVAEDLDCSGLPMCEETVCDYDEGFIAGLMEAYTQKPFDAREVDCWASGARVCRFKAARQKD